MIYNVVLYPFRDTISRFLRTFGAPCREKLRPLFYEELPFLRELQAGTVIFSDTERLSPAQNQIATELANRLEAAGNRVLNHPARVLGRFDFLRALHDAGINSYNVFRVDEVRSGAAKPQFPVFLRRENDHKGSMSQPVKTWAELETQIENALQKSIPVEDLMIVELCETDLQNGVFRKFSAFVIGETFVPRHELWSQNWITKTPDIVSEAQIESEKRFLEQNPHPHEEAVRRAFEIAGLSYGRIDYGLKNGRVEVWEINSNPTIVPKRISPSRLPTQKPIFAAICNGFLGLETPPNAQNLNFANDWRKKWGVGAAKSALFPFERATRRVRRHAIRSFVRIPARLSWLKRKWKRAA